MSKKDKHRNFNSTRGWGVFGGVTEARSYFRTDYFIRGYSSIGFTDGQKPHNLSCSSRIISSISPERYQKDLSSFSIFQ